MKKVWVLFLLGMLLQVRDAKAALVASYSLDARSFTSTDIVEGVIVTTKPIDYWSILASNLKITAVHKGHLKIGSTIQVALSNYYYLPSDTVFVTKNSKQLSQGDHLILFLDVAENSRKIAGFPQIRLPQPSGVNLIQNETVYEWIQGESYNPAIATPINTPDGSADVAIYRTQIAESIKRTNVWRLQLQQPATIANSESLLRVLKRTDLWPLHRDVCNYLIKLGDLDLLLDALKLDPDWGSRSVLYNAFASPKGRELLLSTLETLKPDDPFRLTLSEAINIAGLLYSTTNEKTSNAKTKSKSSGDNARYITRIVALALRKRTDKQLCVSLLAIFPALFPGFENAYDIPEDEDAAEIIKDSTTAVPLLVKLHQSTTDEVIRFGAERGIASLNRKTFARFFPQRGTVVSLVQFLPNAGYTEDPKGKIAFYYTIEILEETNKISKLRKLKPFVVFHHLASGKKWLYQPHLDTEFAFHGMPFVMKQPPELPTGKYHVYLQFQKDGKAISTGNFGEITLTQKLQ